MPRLLPISHSEMVVLEGLVTSFPDDVHMAVADQAQTIISAYGSSDDAQRLAIYDADTLTLTNDGDLNAHLSIQDLRDLMSLRQFDLSNSSFDIQDTPQNLVAFFSSNASDKQAILDEVDAVETFQGPFTLTVAEADTLQANGANILGGYSIQDLTNLVQAEIVSSGDIGVLENATNVSVSDGGTLQISVAELNAIKDTDTGLSATYAIYDESSAIQSVADSVDITMALQNSSAIYLTSVGTVELQVGVTLRLNSHLMKFDNTSDIVVRLICCRHTPQY